MRLVRHTLAPALVFLFVATFVVGISASPVVATPVATNEELYQLYGRVFPDPHGCLDGAPGTSPWAKGDVCAGQFVQWEEALGGLRFLEERFPRYLQVLNLRTMFGDHPAFAGQEFQSAGLPKPDLTRDRRDLYIVKVTDRSSPIPEPDRRHFAYSLSIHGIERAGLEGGIRAIEDLVTWAACEADGTTAPACSTEGPFPKRILEPTNSGPTAGEVLRNGVVYFVFANPDGWHRGELSEGGVFFQRYNGNGMDLNRDFPAIGYTEAQYTPNSEPETKGYTAFLEWVAGQTTEGRFAGGIDLHGMVTAPSFSFTLLGAGQRDYRKNAISVDTSITTFRDSERRLSWSPLIAPAEACPGPVREPAFGGTVPMCSDQWGTVWDTINYQVTGSFGDWMDSPLGLDGVGINNEMALSHLAPNTVFDPQLEQLHIDGNKGLIYAQLASLLFEQPVQFQPGGKVGYVFDPSRIQNPGGGVTESPTNLPSQDDLERLELSGEGVSWNVRGPSDGVFNGGMTVEATCTNGQAIGACTGTGVLEVPMVLEYCGPPEHAGEPEGCREIARYFNQSPVYSQAGARIDVNGPRPGPYRIRANPARVGPVRYAITFSSGQAFDVPEQAPYDVSRMDFFTELNRYIPAGSALQPISVTQVLRKPKTLNAFDSIVAANDLMPGFVPADDYQPAEPAGTPQPKETFVFENGAVPLASAPTYEFDVDPGFDNDQMIVEASWATASDYDLYVDYLNPETNQWENRGCPCEFVNQGESLTVFAPETGRWRVRLENFAALPQRVEGSISFVALASPGSGSQSQYTAREFDRYAGRLAQWTAGGGNLVLTDGAMATLPYLGGAVPAAAIRDGVFYAGWMDFDDGQGPTYDRHPLARGVNMEGTAEGRGTVDGQSFDNRHQTYEPVPLGYFVSESGSANAECDTDRCDSPNWIVDQAAWDSAGGTTAARTLVRGTVMPGSPSRTGVSLGELPLGAGRIRIAGALLPDPTEENY
ncbi:MAG TPA: M14 family zinc carboxypeptidase, partial [Actinomycetota bacterium]|nr:M14 family zinc carboxypeptidase [Actinomycetota bacterium]